MTEPVSEPPPTGSDVNNNPASQPEGQVVVVEPEQDPAETRPSKTSWRQKLCTAESILTFATIGGVLLGGIIGILINSYAESGFPSHAVTPRTASWIKLPGTLFLRALKMIILPLIMSSMINAITHLPPKAAGKIGAFALAFYMFTTIIAVMLGLVLSVVIKPGIGTDKTHLAGGRKGSLPCVARMYPTDTVYDLLHNFVPDNLVEMTFKSASSCANMEIFNPKTKKLRSFHPEEYKGFMEALDDKEKMAQLTDEDKEIAKNMDKNILGTLITVKKNSMNILGLVLVSVCIGVTIIKVGRAAEPLKNFFVSVEAVSMAITTAIIWFSPIGIMCLVAHAVMIMKDPANDFRKLGLYMATVITGLLIHGLIVLPLLYLAIVRKNPLIYMKNMLPAYATAFGTASSSATMPVSMRCLEEVNKVKRSIVTFVVPLGATVNMDGTALYEAAAAIYILQAVRGEMPTFGECLLTSITATLASIGAAGIPSAGLVTMLMVLIAIGVDESYVGLVLPVDWLLDRIRTTVNVHGDAIGAGVVQKLCLMFKVEGLDNEHNTTAGENGPLALPPPPPPPDAPGADQSSSSAVGAGGDAVAVPPARVALATTSPLRSRRSNRGVPPETPEAPEASTQLSNSSRDDSK